LVGCAGRGANRLFDQMEIAIFNLDDEFAFAVNLEQN
jgi:hypothetical protein